MGNLEDVIGTRETNKKWYVQGKLKKNDRYMGNLQDV